MLSRSTLHGIRALAALAGLEPGEYAGAGRIAREISAPQNYLGKLLQQLAREGLVVSQKGLGGGFRLARPADRITLYDVAEPLEQVSRWQGCFMGTGRCSEDHPCRMHGRWGRLRGDYLALLKETHISDLADDRPLQS